MDQFTISNNYFNTMATKMFKNLRDDKNFTDVKIITADNKQIKSHRIILGTYSNFFKNIFIKNKENQTKLS